MTSQQPPTNPSRRGFLGRAALVAAAPAAAAILGPTLFTESASHADAATPDPCRRSPPYCPRYSVRP
jgi:nitrous oxide reductase